MIHFNEFAHEPQSIDGDKITLDSLLNKEIELIQYRLTKSKYAKNESGLCLTLQIKLDDQLRVVFTGSEVLIRQLKQYGDHCPFKTTIKKINKYYTLS